jgi:hypothetical protein
VASTAREANTMRTDEAVPGHEWVTRRHMMAPSLGSLRRRSDSHRTHRSHRAFLPSCAVA